jgi:Dicarboxylate transport
MGKWTKICFLILLLAAGSLFALYRSLPRLSGEIIRETLIRMAFTDVLVEEETLGLHQADFRTIRFRKTMDGFEIEVLLKDVQAEYAYHSFSSRELRALSTEKAVIRFLGPKKPPIDQLKLANVRLRPGKRFFEDPASLEIDYEPQLPESLRSFPLGPFALKTHSLRKVVIDLPERVHLQLAATPGKLPDFSGTMHGRLEAKLGEYKWTFLDLAVKEADFSLSRGKFHLSLPFRLQEKISAKLQGEYDTYSQSGRADFQLEPVLFGQTPLGEKGLFPDLPLPLQLNAGELRLHGRAGIHFVNGALSTESDTVMEARQVGGSWGSLLFSGASARCSHHFRKGSQHLDCPGLALASVAGPFPLQHLELAGLEWEQAKDRTRVHGHDLHFEAIGGEASCPAVELELAKSLTTTQPIRLELRHLDLQELLKLKRTEDFSATGTIDGELPLTLEAAGPRVREGRLKARSEGVIRYAPKSSGLTEVNPALGLALSALGDFHYSELSSRIEYDPGGIMHFAIALAGRNPAFKNGQAFRFNVNVEENILALIKSLTIAGDLDRTFDKEAARPIAPHQGKK